MTITLCYLTLRFNSKWLITKITSRKKPLLLVLLYICLVPYGAVPCGDAVCGVCVVCGVRCAVCGVLGVLELLHHTHTSSTVD